MIDINKVREVLDQIALISESDPSLDRTALVIKVKKIFTSLDQETLTLAINTSLSRPNALEKLGAWAAAGIFSPELLEQASRRAIAQYRSRYFAGLNHVLEIGTGTGSDTAAIARVARYVTTIELDPERAEMAKENLKVQGIKNFTSLTGDLDSVLAGLDLNNFDGLYADPARRSRAGDRFREADDYSPPLELILGLKVGKVRAIKVSPGLFFDPKDTGWVREFLGYGSECLEQTLLWGVATADSSVRLTDLDLGWSPPENQLHLPPPDSLEGFISEAHGVINRSQFLGSFFAERGIALLAPDLAYGVSSNPPAKGPFLDSFRIIESQPFSLKSLKEKLRGLNWSSRTELKKRNSSVDLDELRASLRLPAHTDKAPFGTVFICKWRGVQHAIITERLSD
jgi:SAM-dependent methyltransferase